MKKILNLVIFVLILAAALVVFAACNTPNGSSWRNVSGLRENAFDDGFSIALNSASRGTRNRTFTLTTEELAHIQIHHHDHGGEIVLTISSNGNLDETEVVLNLHELPHLLDVDASHLEAGRIRFSFRFEDARDSSTSINWGHHDNGGHDN